MAIYMPDENTAKNSFIELQRHFEENSSPFNRTVVQLVVDNRPKSSNDDDGRSPHMYPINILRNIAIGSAPTDHILYIDVDFIPSAGAHSEL